MTGSRFSGSSTLSDSSIKIKKMDISVVLCTFNRCEELATALQSVAASTLPATVDWEVLVVDNNSSRSRP